LLELFPNQEAFAAALATATPTSKGYRENLLHYSGFVWERKED
jgi:hypothetical protein